MIENAYLFYVCFMLIVHVTQKTTDTTRSELHPKSFLSNFWGAVQRRCPSTSRISGVEIHATNTVSINPLQPLGSLLHRFLR